MISVIKYLNEMINDEESQTFNERARKEMGPEYDKRLQIMRKAKAGEKGGVDPNKLTPPPAPVAPIPPETGVTKKIIKKVVPGQQEGTEPGTLLKPIKKIIDATRQ